MHSRWRSSSYFHNAEMNKLNNLCTVKKDRINEFIFHSVAAPMKHNSRLRETVCFLLALQHERRTLPLQVCKLFERVSSLPWINTYFVWLWKKKIIKKIMENQTILIIYSSSVNIRFWEVCNLHFYYGTICRANRDIRTFTIFWGGCGKGRLFMTMASMVTNYHDKKL